MPLNAQIHVIKNRLATIGDSIAADVHKVVLETAEEIETRAKAAVPVRTGALRASIYRYGGIVGVGAHYGVYVEFGTSRQAAQPFFIPAIEAARKDFEKRVKAAMQKY